MSIKLSKISFDIFTERQLWVAGVSPQIGTTFATNVVIQTICDLLSDI